MYTEVKTVIIYRALFKRGGVRCAFTACMAWHTEPALCVFYKVVIVHFVHDFLGDCLSDSQLIFRMQPNPLIVGRMKDYNKSPLRVTGQRSKTTFETEPRQLYHSCRSIAVSRAYKPLCPMRAQDISNQPSIGCSCLPSRAASIVSGRSVKFATSELGLCIQSSCPNGTK